jgi:hypothetical protein
MTLDQQLLEKAHAAGARIEAAERESQIARAQYHTLIRRMHLAGASLREIAKPLGLSHQRVQQIVEAEGGSWWHRVWRTRNAKHELICTFCERPQSEVAKLIAGPDVFVCDGCVALAEAALKGKGSTITREDDRSRAKCSFCARARSASRPVVSSPAACMCADCVALCRQILDDRAPAG